MPEVSEIGSAIDRAMDEALEAAAHAAELYHRAYVRILADDPQALRAHDVIAAFRLLAADIRARKPGLRAGREP